MTGFKLFGFQFKKTQQPDSSLTPTGTVHSPVPPTNLDGAVNVQYTAGSGFYGYSIDFDGTIVDDFQLINRYREMPLIAEVDEAVNQIINELVVQDDERLPVTLNLDYVDALDEKMKIRLQAEFNSILKQLNFHKDAYSTLRQWYVDGRIFFYLMVDEKKSKDGILEIRTVDPRCIRKVREMVRKRHPETQAEIIEVLREYFVYNPMGFVSSGTPQQGGSSVTGLSASTMQYNGIKIPLETIAFGPSGLYDTNKRTVLSWLHKAIKPLNLLRMIEDSCVIYRLARAPERRVFYIDVGNLPTAKAEQYLTKMMHQYRNKLVYDVNNGEIRDDRKFMSIMEDFWLPRKEGQKSTEISTLPAGQNLSEMEDVLYFLRKLYRALGLPPSRIEQGTGFSLGRSTEISRDELQFHKHIKRLQMNFSTVFDQILERQLRLKNILTEQEWYRIKDDIRYKWQTDSYFEELKNQEIWTSRVNLLEQMKDSINTFFSTKWVAREILKFSDDEWAAIREDFDQPAIIGGDGEDRMSDNIPSFGAKNKTPFDLDKDGDDILNMPLSNDEDESEDDYDIDLDDTDRRPASKPPKKRSSSKKFKSNTSSSDIDDEDE